MTEKRVIAYKSACHIVSIAIIYTAIGDVAKLVDALDLGSSAARCKSSSLFAPTILKRIIFFKIYSGENPEYASNRGLV